MRDLNLACILTFIFVAGQAWAAEPTVTSSRPYDKTECAIACEETPNKITYEIVKKDVLRNIGESVTTNGSITCSKRLIKELKLTCLACNVACNPIEDTKK